MPHALLVDDDLESLQALDGIFRAEQFTTARAESLRVARVLATRQAPDVLITDLQLPDGRGTELISELDTVAGRIIVVTGQASVESAVEAMRAGADDYLLKPIDVDRLKKSLYELPAAQQSHAAGGPARASPRLLGDSEPMKALYRRLERVGPTSATVLLIGESGTGKELCAQMIHDCSARRMHPFLPINCGAVSPHLVESELFGHEKGSFTGAERQHRGFFERAHGGTLFLDEITEMSPELQVKLLRVLEAGVFMRVGTERPIATDVRIIAATNRKPEEAVAQGKLREDLYHRLNVFPIHVPPLRARGADIEVLAREFLADLNQSNGTSKVFSPAALAELYRHQWPGNVRELWNHVQQAYILADDVIGGAPAPPSFDPPDGERLITFRVGSSLEEIELHVTLATLASCSGVKRSAAELLGISLKTLYNRLEYYASKGLIHPGDGGAQVASFSPRR